jgi:glycerol uptake facilitator-like aquaporin
MQTFPCAHCKKECLSELVGTYLLVVLGPSSIIIASLLSFSKIESLVIIAFSFGATVGLRDGRN